MRRGTLRNLAASSAIVAALVISQRARADVGVPPTELAMAGSRGASAPRAAKLNPTGRAITLTVPLRAQGPLGQVQVTLTADDQLLMAVDDLANALARVVLPDEIARLRAAADKDRRIDIPTLGRLGYRISYDPQAVELNIDIPLSARPQQTLHLGRGLSIEHVEPDTSANVAAFLNYRVGTTYEFTGSQRKKWDVLGDFQLAGRLFQQVAFENFATLDTLSDHKFVRTASRASVDLPGPAWRITAGDLITESAGLQGNPQISGANLSHLVDTFYPDRPPSANSSNNLFLSRDSDVQILVNGVPVSQIHLGPGSYDLRNLPVTQGANHVQAVIIDATGQRRVQSFSFFSDAQLLDPGLTEYTLSAGVIAPFGNSGPHYTSDVAASGFYRLGINQQLTAGVNFQAAKYDQMVGVNATVGTDFGLFSLDTAFNHQQTGQFGGAMRFQYRYASHTNTIYMARTFDFSVEYQSTYFLPLSSFNRVPSRVTSALAPGVPLPVDFDLATLDNRNTQALLLAASLTQPVSRKFAIQIDGSFARNRSGVGNTGAVSALMTYQAPFQSTVGLGVTYQWIPHNNSASLISGRGISFLLTLTHQFGRHATATGTADRFQQHASFNRSAARQIDDYYVNADVSHNDFGSYGNALAGYETNRGDIQGLYSTSFDEHGHVSSQQGGMLFSGSVAMADGHVGLGRQITDSFAVIRKDPSLGNRQLVIQDRTADEPIARSGTFGPAVVPLSAYTPAVVPYDVRDLPPGYDLGDGNFDLYPWRHSGTAFKVGSPYHMSALGDLLDEDGKPLALRTGRAVSLTDAHAPHADVITNRAGHFAALGLAPGRYRITMSGDTPLVYEMTITQKPEMFERVGTLHPSAEGR